MLLRPVLRLPFAGLRKVKLKTLSIWPRIYEGLAKKDQHPEKAGKMAPKTNEGMEAPTKQLAIKTTGGHKHNLRGRD
jgi:hypothetical protein